MPGDLEALLDRSRPLAERIGGGLQDPHPPLASTHQTALLSRLADPQEHDTVRHEIAVRLRREGCAGLDAGLAAILDHAGERPRFRGFAMQHLGVALAEASGAGADALATLLETGLADPDEPVRREALLGLTRARPDVAGTWIRANLETPAQVGMRDALVRCAGDADLRDLLPNLRRFATAPDPDPAVQVAAIAVLGRWGDQTCREPFARLAAGSDPAIAAAADLALRRLDGAAAPPPR